LGARATKIDLGRNGYAGCLLFVCGVLTLLNFSKNKKKQFF
jgi:hypothetical protein